MRKFVFVFLVSVFLISCGKENNIKEGTDNKNDQILDSSQENPDSTMTVEETFSSALIQDILGEEEDPDLQGFLEEQIYPLVSKSDKVTFDRISSSLYLLSYDDKGTLKNILIQKFYSPLKDEIVFDKKETEINSIRQFVK